MDIATAIKIIEHYQRWRIGEEEHQQFDPKTITEALNLLLADVKSHNK